MNHIWQQIYDIPIKYVHAIGAWKCLNCQYEIYDQTSRRIPDSNRKVYYGGKDLTCYQLCVIHIAKIMES